MATPSQGGSPDVANYLAGLFQQVWVWGVIAVGGALWYLIGYFISNEIFKKISKLEEENKALTETLAEQKKEIADLKKISEAQIAAHTFIQQQLKQISDMQQTLFALVAGNEHKH